MSALENYKNKVKNFGPTTWSIKNRTAVYLIILVVTLMGVGQFVTLPKELLNQIVLLSVKNF